MTSIKEYKKFAENQCEYYMFQMCKERSDKLRKCALPRCCSICGKIKECEYVCTPIKKNF